MVKEYFTTIIPYNDNKFAALNTAVWSGGSFIYVPPGVHVDQPLQAYFRINAESMGQFERTLIVAEEGDRLIPVYEQMTLVGVDLQYTRDSWLWKFGSREVPSKIVAPTSTSPK